VNIRFTSSLTPEDENIVALAVLNALSGVLDLLPIAYTIRIDTSDSQVYQHSGPDRQRQSSVHALRSPADTIMPADS